MRIEQLYYLVELSKTRSMSRLAENNYISHQSVSKAIYQLEEEFGIKLLNRTSKGVSLTEIGEKFAEKAAEVIKKLEELNDFKCIESEETNSPKEILLISVGSNTSIITLPDVITEFTKNNPYAKVKIIDQQDSDIIRNIENGKADFGLILSTFNGLKDNKIGGESELVFEKLFHPKLAIAVAKKHPFASKESVSIKQAIKEPLVLYEQHVYVNKSLYGYGNPNIYHVSNSVEVIMITVAEGAALCIGKQSVIEPVFKDKEEYSIIPIREKTKLVIGILHSMKYPLSPLAREFISMLKSSL